MHAHKHTHTDHTQLVLVTVVIFYKVTMDTELANIELLVLEERWGKFPHVSDHNILVNPNSIQVI